MLGIVIDVWVCAERYALAVAYVAFIVCCSDSCRQDAVSRTIEKKSFVELLLSSSSSSQEGNAL